MIPGSANPLLLKSAAAAGGYQVSRSLRFNSSDSGFCARTPAVAGNRRTWTWAGWVKKCNNSAQQSFFSAGNSGTNRSNLLFQGTGEIRFFNYPGSVDVDLITTPVFRDPSAWYHILIAVDTTQATSTNRFKLYVNGTQFSTFSTATYPSLNQDLVINSAIAHGLGRGEQVGEYFDGYLADIHFIDGQALTPSSFTEVSATTGQLVPIAYTGTFGTNGFQLKFADNSSNTAATLGKDTSGNSNNWTPNNFSVVSGTGVVATPASNAPPTVDYLVVGGGGGGGCHTGGTGVGGGGGAGGFRTANGFSVTSSTQYTVTVGAGGAGAASGTQKGSSGTNSVFSTILASGGGGGGGYDTGTGLDGGSGGGGGQNNTGTTAGGTGNSGTYSPSEGSNGGTGANSAGGGGGGAGDTGQNSPSVGQGGTGGAGTASSISGSSVTYAGGGGGGTYSFLGGSVASGGSGGGGAGAADPTNPANAVSGTANLGGGGGGGIDARAGASGGSGVVILRYANTYADLTVGGGLTYTYVNTGGYKIYSFTASATAAQSAGNDSLLDTPTSYGTDTGVGGEVRGNYCTWNPLDKSGNTSVANGNLEATGGSSPQYGSIRGSVAVQSGKFYFEATASTASGGYVGIADANAAFNAFNIIDDVNIAAIFSFSSSNGIYINSSAVAYTTNYSNNDVVGVAFDQTNKKVWFAVNNVWQGSGTQNPATNAGGYTYTGMTSAAPYFADGVGGSAPVAIANFGQRAFAYTAPSGFKALCDTNLGAPLVAKPNQNFDIITYPGNGSTQTLPNATSTPATALDFGGVGQIGFSWIKQRSDPSTSHALYDARRGVQARLESDTQDQEATSDNGVTAFNAGTFALGSQAQANSSSETYVAWCWATAAQDSSSHTQGSITSQVRANVSAGFSVATWSGSSSNSTVGHGLGVAPSLVIVKTRNSAPTNFHVYHSSLGTGSTLYLDAAASAGPGVWNSTSPTSTVFSVSPNNQNVNYPGRDYVSYHFAPVVGYSSFGSYTGNGIADGPFVYTGFRPRWVMVKSTGSAENWFLLDTARNTYNAVNSYLMPNSPSAEDANNSTVNTDFLSNGFKLRATTSALNTNTITYIYAAFAENPFQYARAR